MRLGIILAILGVSLILGSCDSLSDDNEAPVIPVRVDLKFKVGEFVYDNIDGTVQVSAYSDAEKLEWSHAFEYIGGSENILPIPGTYHHYRFSVSKWGQTDEEVFTLVQLQEQRADKATPGVIVLGGEVPAKKLGQVTYYLNSGGEEAPVSRTVYYYDEAGKINGIVEKTYNTEVQNFLLSGYNTFEYENNRVKKKLRYEATNDQLIEDLSYEYLADGNVLKMVQTQYSSGTSTTADLSYDNTTGESTAVYSVSNGNAFTYRFTIKAKNIVDEKVIQGAVTCQEGVFTYDKSLNPYKHLGFIDFGLSYMSANNRLTESIVYSCSIPTMIPVSYEYQYDSDGYPTNCIISYKGGGKDRFTFEYK